MEELSCFFRLLRLYYTCLINVKTGKLALFSSFLTLRGNFLKIFYLSDVISMGFITSLAVMSFVRVEGTS